MDSDVIIAPATPSAASALGLLRISGTGCLDIIRRMVGREISIRRASLAKLHEGNELIDEIIVTTWKGPSSYTGEDMVEISCHGNPLIIKKIIQYWTRTGARLANPGEFTQRAFLNGKMDLPQAEAVLDIIHAQSERSLHFAQNALEGGLSRILRHQRENLLQLLAHIEAHIDFPEEDITPETGEIFTQKIKSLMQDVSSLLKTANEGRKLREGVRVALVGPPNSGKSSLLNALLGHDRAIVSDIPGTTRDTVEESLILDGIPIRFIDTAGLRETSDAIERLGVERSLQAVEKSDLVIILHDITLPLQKEFYDFKDKPTLLCLTKHDLPHSRTSVDAIRVSSLTGDGIDDLKKSIVEKLGVSSASSEQQVIINTRHEILLQEVQASLVHALEASQQNKPPELVSSDLRQALRSLAEIVGETTNEDILDRLFSTFCIGK